MGGNSIWENSGTVDRWADLLRLGSTGNEPCEMSFVATGLEIFSAVKAAARPPHSKALWRGLCAELCRQGLDLLAGVFE
jgi:hypothetical protein